MKKRYPLLGIPKKQLLHLTNVNYSYVSESPNFHLIPDIRQLFPKGENNNKTDHSLTYTRATLTFTFPEPCKNSSKFAIKETISTRVGSWSKGGTKGRSHYPDIARGNSIPTAFHIYKRGPSFVQRTIFPGWFTSSCKPNKKKKRKKEKKGKERYERNRFVHRSNMDITLLRISQAGQLLSIPETNCNFFFVDGSRVRINQAKREKKKHERSRDSCAFRD